LLQNHSTDQNAYKALEDLLVIHGLEIMQSRNTIITKLNATSDAQIVLHDILNIDSPNIKEEWLARLANSRNSEHTNIGPHKTEIRIQSEGKDGLSASTGEQNSMLISILCAAFQALEQNIKILLLDDVLAHLDNKNRDKILDFIQAQDQYVCMTDVFGLGLGGLELV
jgi:recombinational DNA repair ATPase RecF